MARLPVALYAAMISRRQNASPTLPPGSPPTTSLPQNDVNYGPLVLGVCTASTIVMVLFVACRVWTKATIVRQWTWDDGT